MAKNATKTIIICNNVDGNYITGLDIAKEQTIFGKGYLFDNSKRTIPLRVLQGVIDGEVTFDKFAGKNVPVYTLVEGDIEDVKKLAENTSYNAANYFEQNIPVSSEEPQVASGSKTSGERKKTAS